MFGVREWYALEVRQRTEKFTAQLLNPKGYEPSLPTYLMTSEMLSVFQGR